MSASNMESMSLSWHKYILQLNDGKFKKSDNPQIVSFKYPGLVIDQYDREGIPNITFVLRFFISVRNCGLFTPYDGNDKCFCDWPDMRKDTLSFIASTSLTFARGFYQKSFAKWLLDARLSLGHVGNTSCSVDVSIYTLGSIIPIASQTINHVFVDNVTRKPRRLPEWFSAKYKGMGIIDSPSRISALLKPKKTYSYQVKVMWSETDRNNHTNYASYVMYAINGIRSALELKETASPVDEISKQQTNQSLKGISSEILTNGLKSLQIRFLKESLEGDILDIHLWQKDGHALSVNCVVESKGRDLCHIQLEYYNTLSNL